MARKPNDRASRVEIIAIHQRLADTVTKLDGGLCVFADGVSDQSIADELKVSPLSVRGLRQEMFGKLRPAAPTGDPRIDELVTFTDNLLTAHSVLKDRLNKLILMLAINQRLDCKHLEIK